MFEGTKLGCVNNVSHSYFITGLLGRMDGTEMRVLAAMYRNLSEIGLIECPLITLLLVYFATCDKCCVWENHALAFKVICLPSFECFTPSTNEHSESKSESSLLIPFLQRLPRQSANGVEIYCVCVKHRVVSKFGSRTF